MEQIEEMEKITKEEYSKKLRKILVKEFSFSKIEIRNFEMMQ